MIAAIILAGGESRRMGSPKALVGFRGLTFVEHLLAATRHPRIGVTRIVLGAGADSIRSQLTAGTSKIVVNLEWEKGPLSSIQTGLRSLDGAEVEGALLCPVDHPLVTLHLVASMIEAFDATRCAIVLPTYHGRRGHPVLFRSTLFHELMAAPMDTGARAVVRAHANEIASVPTEEEGVILNLDDPASMTELGAS
ncbi:MAG: nucleotidyltransferase family protein [Candidatus Acidiferrales bacterium]|jgi:molybdenum cofactor cytidylyltransferase